LKDILILLVEDARDLRKIASACLSQSGARVDAVASITDARRRVLKAPPNLLILDPDSQSEDILSFLSELGSLGIDTIMLTDRLDGDSRIDFFERGVLDIVPKPLQPHELFLRVMRFWKPKRGGVVPAQIETACGAAMLDITTRTLRNGRKPGVALTGSEFRLLYLLIQNEHRVVERAEIARTVLGQGQDGLSRSIDVMISKLRRKLEDVSSGQFIRSVRSEGYMLIGEERIVSLQERGASQANENPNLVGRT